MTIYLVALVVSLLPGAILGFVLPPGPQRWVTWSTAPALSLGLIAIGLAWLPALGLPSGPAALAVGEVVVALAAVAVSVVLHHRRAGRPVPAGDTGGEAGDTGGEALTWRSWFGWAAMRPRLADVCSIGVAAASVAAVSWKVLHRLSYPPGWDAMNHALLTRNIMASGSTAVTKVCVSGSSAPQISCHFYPLGADATWAQLASMTGGQVSRAMMAWTILVGPLALVLAVYAVVRVFGGRPVVAGAAAVAAGLVGPMWPSLQTGRAPEAYGPGWAVAVALLAALALRGRNPIRLGLLAGLGMAGLALTHTYEVLFAATLAAALPFAEAWRQKGRAVLVGLGAAVVGTVLALGPVIGSLVGAGGERTADGTPGFLGDVGGAFRYWVTDLQNYALLSPSPYNPHPLGIWSMQVALWFVVVGFIASPLCFVFARLSWARPWVFMWLLWTAVGIWTSSSGSSAATTVAGLWYGVAARLRTMVLPIYGILAVAGLCGLALAAQRLAVPLLRRARPARAEGADAGPLVASALAGLLAVVLLAMTFVPASRATINAELRKTTPRGSAYPDVYAWLAAHTPPDKVVAYDRHVEFMTWSYADYGVKPLFGIPPLAVLPQEDYQDRWQVFNWLIGTPGTPPSGCLVRRYAVQYVVLGSQRIPRWPRHYRRATVPASPNLTLVHRDHGIDVYQVTPAGLACTGTTG